MRPRLLALLLLCAGCAGEGESSAASAGEACRIEQRPTDLPPVLRESSGLAASRRHAGVLWSHNDSGGEPVVVALRRDGTVLGATRVAGARVRDWEDAALGPCPRGGDCLYLADTGDNNERRSDAALYRVPEPAPGARSTAPAERLPLRFPDRPRDVEALFVLPDGGIFLVTKGRSDPAAVWRYPGPPRAGAAAVLERVAALSPEKLPVLQQVTGAAASADGEWVAVRSYSTLAFHRAAELVRGEVRPRALVDLTPLYEAQGEAVALAADGRVVLTSEGRGQRVPAAVSVLACNLLEAGGSR